MFSEFLQNYLFKIGILESYIKMWKSGINKHKKNFKTTKNKGQVQFVVFERFTSAYSFQLAREKPIDYLLIIYKWQFLSRLSVLRGKWWVKPLQLYWLNIWHVNSGVKIHILSPSHVWKLSSCFRLWKAVFPTSKIALITDLGLIDMFPANPTAEIVACILWRLKFSAKT